MTAPFMKIPRLSKRRTTRMIAWALANYKVYGPPVFYGRAIESSRYSLCDACGSAITPGEWIQQATQGDFDLGWVHITCPSPHGLIIAQLESLDDVIIASYQFGRDNASGCGHNVDGDPVYRTVSVKSDESWSYVYLCEGCVTR